MADITLTDAEREKANEQFYAWWNEWPKPSNEEIVMRALAAVPRLALASPMVAERTCEWKYYDWPESDSTFESACGSTWAYLDGGPAENEQRYCHKCGGKIVLLPPPADDDENDDDEASPAALTGEGDRDGGD
jgi:hypothetical protein